MWYTFLGLLMLGSGPGGVGVAETISVCVVLWWGLGCDDGVCVCICVLVFGGVFGGNWILREFWLSGSFLSTLCFETITNLAMERFVVCHVSEVKRNVINLGSFRLFGMSNKMFMMQSFCMILQFYTTCITWNDQSNFKDISLTHTYICFFTYIYIWNNVIIKIWF